MLHIICVSVESTVYNILYCIVYTMHAQWKYTFQHKMASTQSNYIKSILSYKLGKGCKYQIQLFTIFFLALFYRYNFFFSNRNLLTRIRAIT